MKHLIPLNESEDLYSSINKVEVSYYDATYKGRDIEDVSINDINLKFKIEIDARSWGIKDISLYDITGPTEIPVLITYYPDDGVDTDSVEEELILNLDWSKVETEEQKNQGYLNIDHIEIELESDTSAGILVGQFGRMKGSGSIQVKKLIAHINTF
jgi:hypothetical protein